MIKYINVKILFLLFVSLSSFNSVVAGVSLDGIPVGGAMLPELHLAERMALFVLDEGEDDEIDEIDEMAEAHALATRMTDFVLDDQEVVEDPCVAHGKNDRRVRDRGPQIK